MADPIAVVPYSDEWPATFETLRASVRNALGVVGRRVEHIGSTSVPGLPAKPIIDIDVVIERDGQLDEVIERLTAVGYVFQGDKGVTGRYAFESPPGSPDHHLYVCVEGSRELRRRPRNASTPASLVPRLSSPASGRSRNLWKAETGARAAAPGRPGGVHRRQERVDRAGLAAGERRDAVRVDVRPRAGVARCRTPSGCFPPSAGILVCGCLAAGK